MQNCDIKLLIQGSDLMGIQLPAPAIDLLCRYYNELFKWNKKINLVARAGEREIIEKHFLDSLTLLPFMQKQAEKKWLDVGSGGGFPGLVVKICHPELDLTLVEPRRKKVTFLKHVIRTLGLQQIQVREARLEAGDQTLFDGQTFPLISSRALSKVRDFLDLTESFSPPGGKVICMKGARAEEELADWREKRPDSPYELVEKTEWRLPFSGGKRIVFIFKKTTK